MYVSRIKLSNIRAIRELDVSVEGKALPLHSVLIGKNSTCKTSILRCIALGLCESSQATALLAELPGTLVGEWGSVGTIELTLTPGRHQNGTKIQSITKIERKPVVDKGRQKTPMYQDIIGEKRFMPGGSKLPRRLFVCAYGAGRGVDGTDTWDRYQPVDAVYSLFRYDETLFNPELILHRARDYYKGRSSRLADALRRVLGLTKKHKFSLTYTGVRVSGPDIGKNVPLSAMADGYKGTFVWLCDFIGWAMLANELGRDLGTTEGILIVDEIDQHLHPSLQIDLLPKLRRILPRLQVICSTHSPFVALSVSGKGLFSLRRIKGTVTLMPRVDGLGEYEVQDVSEDARLFNLPSADSRGLSRALAEYRRLSQLSKSRRTGKVMKRLSVLAKKLAKSGVPLREELQLVQQLQALKDRAGV